MDSIGHKGVNNLYSGALTESNRDNLVKKQKYDCLFEAHGFINNYLAKKEDLNTAIEQIQKDLNKSQFNFDNTVRGLKNKLQLDNTKENEEAVKKFVINVALLAKHDTKSNTKTNWFYFTNKTTHIALLLDSAKCEEYIKQQGQLSEADTLKSQLLGGERKNKDVRDYFYDKSKYTNKEKENFARKIRYDMGIGFGGNQTKLKGKDYKSADNYFSMATAIINQAQIKQSANEQMEKIPNHLNELYDEIKLDDAIIVPKSSSEVTDICSSIHDLISLLPNLQNQEDDVEERNQILSHLHDLLQQYTKILQTLNNGSITIDSGEKDTLLKIANFFNEAFNHQYVKQDRSRANAAEFINHVKERLDISQLPNNPPGDATHTRKQGQLGFINPFRGNKIKDAQEKEKKDFEQLIKKNKREVVPKFNELAEQFEKDILNFTQGSAKFIDFKSIFNTYKKLNEEYQNALKNNAAPPKKLAKMRLKLDTYKQHLTNLIKLGKLVNSLNPAYLGTKPEQFAKGLYGLHIIKQAMMDPNASLKDKNDLLNYIFNLIAKGKPLKSDSRYSNFKSLNKELSEQESKVENIVVDNAPEEIPAALAAKFPELNLNNLTVEIENFSETCTSYVNSSNVIKNKSGYHAKDYNAFKDGELQLQSLIPTIEYFKNLSLPENQVAEDIDPIIANIDKCNFNNTIAKENYSQLVVNLATERIAIMGPIWEGTFAAFNKAFESIETQIQPINAKDTKHANYIEQLLKMFDAAVKAKDLEDFMKSKLPIPDYQLRYSSYMESVFYFAKKYDKKTFEKYVKNLNTEVGVIQFRKAAQDAKAELTLKALANELYNYNVRLSDDTDLEDKKNCLVYDKDNDRFTYNGETLNFESHPELKNKFLHVLQEHNNSRLDNFKPSVIKYQDLCQVLGKEPDFEIKLPFNLKALLEPEFSSENLGDAATILSAFSEFKEQMKPIYQTASNWVDLLENTDAEAIGIKKLESTLILARNIFEDLHAQFHEYLKVKAMLMQLPDKIDNATFTQLLIKCKSFELALTGLIKKYDSLLASLKQEHIQDSAKFSTTLKSQFENILQKDKGQFEKLLSDVKQMNFGAQLQNREINEGAFDKLKQLVEAANIVNDGIIASLGDYYSKICTAINSAECSILPFYIASMLIANPRQLEFNEIYQAFSRYFVNGRYIVGKDGIEHINNHNNGYQIFAQNNLMPVVRAKKENDSLLKIVQDSLKTDFFNLNANKQNKENLANHLFRPGGNDTAEYQIQQSDKKNDEFIKNHIKSFDFNSNLISKRAFNNSTVINNSKMETDSILNKPANELYNDDDGKLILSQAYNALQGKLIYYAAKNKLSAKAQHNLLLLQSISLQMLNLLGLIHDNVNELNLKKLPKNARIDTEVAVEILDILNFLYQACTNNLTEREILENLKQEDLVSINNFMKSINHKLQSKILPENKKEKIKDLEDTVQEFVNFMKKPDGQVSELEDQIKAFKFSNTYKARSNKIMAHDGKTGQAGTALLYFKLFSMYRKWHENDQLENSVRQIQQMNNNYKVEKFI